MAQRKHEPGPPMDLANMRRQGMHNLIAYCLNDSCRHQAPIRPILKSPISGAPGRLCEMWRSGQQDRRAPQLERGAGLD